MTVAAIGYLRLQCTDLAAMMDCATNVFGLMDAGARDGDDARYLRMDAHPFRFMLEPGERDGLSAIGLQYRSAAQLQACCDRLQDSGYELTAGSDSESARRGVSDFVTLDDPSGNTLELYHGRELDYRPFNSPAGVDRFVTGCAATGDLGFGHVVIPAPETQRTIDFYTRDLGLGICDTLTLAMPPSKVIFMHADNARQHSLALYDQPHPVGVVHAMIEVETLDAVGLALDRAKRAGLPIVASLGRHVNDNMCSFYVMAPGGVVFEYGYDGLLVPDWDLYQPTNSVAGDLWGHEYNFPGMGDGD